MTEQPEPDLEPDKSWVLADPTYAPDPGVLFLREADEDDDDFDEWEVVLQPDGIVKAAHRRHGAKVFSDDWCRFVRDRPGLWIHRISLPFYEPFPSYGTP